MVAEPGLDVRIWPLICGLTFLAVVGQASRANCHVRLTLAESGPVRPAVPNTCRSFHTTGPLAMMRLRPQWRPVDAVRVRVAGGDVVGRDALTT
jgi:hypothetical protein